MSCCPHGLIQILEALDLELAVPPDGNGAGSENLAAGPEHDQAGSSERITGKEGIEENHDPERGSERDQKFSPVRGMVGWIG